MARIAAQIDLALSPELCQQAVQAALTDERLHVANRMLRPGKEYSGWVTHLVPGRRVDLVYAAYDPSSGGRSHRLGWRVSYEFLPLEGGRTRAEVAIEYGWLAGVAAGGTLRAQAVNDISHRLAALHALELGLLAGRAAAGSGDAAGPTRDALPGATPGAGAAGVHSPTPEGALPWRP
jgi:hypothetical protein